MSEFKNGVLSAPALTVAPCGLLSVAFVDSHGGNEQWLRGYSAETDSYPTVRILTINNDAVTNGTVTDGAGKASHQPVTSFIIEAEISQSGMGLLGEDSLPETIKDQIDAISQKALEYELWEGHAAQALTPTAGTQYLRKTGGATVVTTSGGTSEKALYLLEQAISNSPTGQRGIIHMTRDVASTLGSRLLLKDVAKDSTGNTYAVTRLGTLVVIGSGYTGAGPIGATGAAASATNKWMFATGGVFIDLGSSEVSATNFDPATNDAIAVVQRPAAIHFDQSIWYAAQVTLS